MIFFTDPTTDTDATSPLYTAAGLNRYLASSSPRPRLLSRSDYRGLIPAQKAVYDQGRTQFLSGGVLVNTRQLTKAKKDIVSLLNENAGRNGDNRGLMFSGKATLGKTTTAKALMRFVHTMYVKQFPGYAGNNRYPVVYISVPTGCTPKLLMVAFAKFFGLTTGRTEDADSIKSRVIETLRAAGTQLVVIDELQNLAAANRGNGESIDVLKLVHDHVRATFVYAGLNLTNSPLFTGDKGDQLRGRFSTTELTRFNLTNPEHLNDWQGIIKQFEDALPLADHERGTLVPMAHYLHDRTNGSLGSLARLLTGTAIGLISDRSDPTEALTRKVLDSYTLDDSAENHYKSVRAMSKKAKAA